LRQLAIFWLVCAATGFAAAVSVAFLLSLAIDHRRTWTHPAPIPVARVLEQLEGARPRPAATSAAEVASFG
jgi:hypothetical protein